MGRPFHGSAVKEQRPRPLFGCYKLILNERPYERDEGVLNTSKPPNPLAVDRDTSGSTGLFLYRKNRLRAINETLRFLFSPKRSLKV